MEDFVTRFDNYSIQFNKTLEFACGGDWDPVSYTHLRAHETF